jgi:hypothetical protein
MFTWAKTAQPVKCLIEGWATKLSSHKMMMNDNECGAISGMIGRRNRNTWRKPAPVLLCPPQIPHDLT